MFSDALLHNLKTAKRVAVLTGAGISAESGVPTFRGENGLWKKYRSEELANFNAFMKNPKLVWEWYNYRRNLITNVNPNPGHYALADMEKMFPEFSLITQNVDGLHYKAGNKNIFDLHGNILRNRCVDCGKVTMDLEIDIEKGVPLCDCGGKIRPDVVWFGEMLPQSVLNGAIVAAEKADVFLSIGTSALVQPAASLPLTAKFYGAYVLEINIEPTPISQSVHESILGKSGEILPKLLEQLTSFESA